MYHVTCLVIDLNLKLKLQKTFLFKWNSTDIILFPSREQRVAVTPTHTSQTTHLGRIHPLYKQKNSLLSFSPSGLFFSYLLYISVMAAVTSVRTSKGILIYTLLSLVCFGCAMFETDLLTKVKESHQLAKERYEKLKNDRKTFVDIISDRIRSYMNIVEPMMYREEFPEQIKQTKELLDKLKTYVATENSKLDIEIEALEVLLKENDQIINCLDGNQRDEL
ncbi:uncharacterized protein LOC119786649 [Cyprinodon tularosa]|uniref:uncharacterized protein LOC119786649 n=1 Tax=Cyprinodon tularosa TaxID=77115 RepID=UPI0018E28860|nr:uncharacterized protein LOC119786649 [Cyprinodon tularosa]